MRKHYLLLLIILMSVRYTYSQCGQPYGKVVISEIYFDTRYNEKIGSKYHFFGEYIELYNSSTEPINLLNWVIKDNHTEFKFTQNDGMNNDLTIQPGGFKVITYNGFYASNGHYGASSEIGGRTKFLELFPLPQIANASQDVILQNRIVLFNEVDKVSLYTPNGILADEISYLNQQTSKTNPKDYMKVQDYSVVINPMIDNGNGGVFNGAIGDMLIFMPGTGYVNVPTSFYKKAIYRQNAADYYSNGGHTFVVANATPLSGVQVPLLPIDPMLFYSPANQNRNYTDAFSYDVKTGQQIGKARSYYDDLGRPDVTLAQDFNTGYTWGSENIYDNFGRIYRESFPTVTCLGMDRVGFLSDPIAKANFLDRYYGNNNTLEPYQATAEYPFVQSNYDPLNPTNILNAVGGNTVTENGSQVWKTNFSVVVPATQEMYYVYGHSYFPGTVSGSNKKVEAKYYKSVTIDANGVENISISDSAGKLLAAARSGGSEAPYTYPVVSVIGTQGFIDIHIPSNTPSGTLIGSAFNYEVFDLRTGLPVTTSGTLPSGRLYRIVAKTPPTVDPDVLVNQTSGAITTTATLGVNYQVNYYDFNLNIYNKTGQLIKNVQPNAFRQVFQTNMSLTSSPSYMSGSAGPFSSKYTYDQSGNVKQSSNPDLGTSQYAYRKDGLIRYSQSAIQAPLNQVSYTNYDSYGRAIESGVVTGQNSSVWSLASGDPDGILIAGTLSERTFTVYDYADNNTLLTYQLPASYSLSNLLAVNTPPLSSANYIQRATAQNVAVSYKLDSSNNLASITWYSYDVYGHPDWMVQWISGIGLKTIHYQYDQYGNVKSVIYQKDKTSEYFAHLYYYNLGNDMTRVEIQTAPTATPIEQVAYSYYLSGELKRIKYGPGSGIQGKDLVYTLGGQLKSINHPSLESSKDPGGDANDVFGLTLDYYSGDYTRNGSNISTSGSVASDYTGSIRAARWANKKKDVANPSVPVSASNPLQQNSGYLYDYDRNGFLTSARYGTVNNQTAISPGQTYNENNLTYDANGNIKSLTRSNQSGTVVDNFTYNYANTSKNQLTSISDSVSATTASDDIDSQNANNYVYNAIGQLIQNVQEDLYYFYDVTGVVTSVRKGSSTPLVKFYYNERGQRIRKETYSPTTPNLITATEYYVLDLSGNILSMYRKDGSQPIVQTEMPVYGLDRVAIFNKQDSSTSYEITDHLGNVRAVIRQAGSVVDVLSYADYYPFGEKLPNRNSGSNYRYAFQGQQFDAETGMEAFQLRLWDGRIGRWLSPDPKSQYASPYLGMGNNPLSLIDPDGGSTYDFYRNLTNNTVEWFDTSEQIDGYEHLGVAFTEERLNTEGISEVVRWGESRYGSIVSWSKEGGFFQHNFNLPELVIVTTSSHSGSAAIAQRIIDSGRVTFGTLHPAPPSPIYKDDLANADDNIRDAAAGRKAHTSEYGHAKGRLVALSPKLLLLIEGLSDDYTISISEIAGAEHSSNSRHYLGKAIDITVINGKAVSSGNPHYKALMAKARSLGATEVLGPGSAGHGGHVHLGLPRK